MESNDILEDFYKTPCVPLGVIGKHRESCEECILICLRCVETLVYNFPCKVEQKYYFMHCIELHPRGNEGSNLRSCAELHDVSALQGVIAATTLGLKVLVCVQPQRLR